MSLEGDRLSIPTQNGDVRVERTQQGVRVSTGQGGGLEISLGQARALAQSLQTISQGSGMPSGMRQHRSNFGSQS